MRRCLIVFAKEPQAGSVKTRLSRCLPERQTVRLYKAFLKDTLDLAKKARCEVRVVAYTSNGRDPRYLARIGPSFLFYKQEGKNLGERMYNAFTFAADKKAERTVILGSDSPTVPLSYIARAFGALGRNDIVIGPSRDGGYYLIGLKRPCFGIFKGVQWSSGSVFERSVKNARRLHKRVAVLDAWYDVDTARDLECLKTDLQKRKKSVASWTRQILFRL